MVVLTAVVVVVGVVVARLVVVVGANVVVVLVFVVVGPYGSLSLHSIDAAYSYRRSAVVYLYVTICVLIVTVCPAKAVEPIELALGEYSVGSGKHHLMNTSD